MIFITQDRTKIMETVIASGTRYDHGKSRHGERM